MLRRRLQAAVERAGAALRVAAAPPAGLDLSALEAPIDKVVAEAAILAREAADALGLGLATEVAPLARAPRLLVALALRPSVALDLAVGHILLEDIGLRDASMRAALARAWASPVAGMRERLPHRALEQEWLAALAGLAPRPGTDAVARTAMVLGVDLPGVSRDDLYALTHAIAYATDFGRWPVPAGVDGAAVLALCESALAITLDDDDFDLAAELVMAWPCLRTPLSPVAAYAFGVLCQVEDRAGILPSLTLRRVAVEAQPERLRAAHTVVTAYHTALVMGLACALLLRAGGAAPLLSGAPLCVAPHGRQWEAVPGAPGVFQRDVALHRALRRADFPAARAALAAGAAAGVVASPLALQVAQMLVRLGAMGEALAA